MNPSVRSPGWRLFLGHARPGAQAAWRVAHPCGYSGGDVPNATYRNHGTHAEALLRCLDPRRRAFATCGVLLPDPRSEHPGRLGNDRGSSYRSAIFYTSDEQLARRSRPLPM